MFVQMVCQLLACVDDSLCKLFRTLLGRQLLSESHDSIGLQLSWIPDVVPKYEAYCDAIALCGIRHFFHGIVEAEPFHATADVQEVEGHAFETAFLTSLHPAQGLGAYLINIVVEVDSHFLNSE